MSETKCKGCGKDIVYIVSAKTGKPMPVNPECVSVVTEDGVVVRGHVSHFATCPDAARFRAGKKATT